MSSVWKRLQRVGKNASKFQFTASFESLTVECEKSGKWQPNKLSIVWTRRKRRMCTKLHTWNPGISNPFRGVIVWAEPEDLEMSVTLYKDSRPGSPYEDKEWSFIIEDESTTGRRKPIAHVTINMVEYASMEFTTKDVSLKLKLSSKKLVYASLDFQMSCVLIKEGKATDEDMISIGSMMSLNEIGSVRDFEIEPQIATPQPVRSYKRALSGGYSLPRAKSFGKKDHSESTESAQNMSPVLLKRTRSKSTTPSFNKYSVSDSKDTYMVDRRLSSASQVSMDGDDTWDVIKDMSNAEGDLIKWCRTCTKGYKGVKIKNTTTSWRDGLAFCAILHHFHPNLIDFSSLDSENIKENNKLAFDGFEKLGIARLLDPTTMAITSVPDKLSMITYLFQIKTHFTKPEIPVTHRKHKHFKLFRKHGSSSDSYKVKNKEPKLDIIATVSENVDENESSTSGVERNVDDFSMTRDKVDEPENHLVTRPRDEVKSEDVTEHATVKRKDDEIKIEMADDDEAKRKSGYNPFEDEDENEFKIDIVEDDPPKTAIIEVKNERIERSVSPQKEYNPFDDEEDEPESPTNRLADIITETKQGYNPFDSESDDNPASPTETKTNAQATVNTVTAEERLGYNPFDDKEEEVGEPSAGSGETSGSTRGYNPFDDEDDDEPERPTKVEPDKPSFRRTRLTASGRKIKLPAPKPRGAPYRPQQDKPTALPRNASSLASRQNAGDTSVTRRKLPPNPKPRPSRPAPRPPGMAPKETNKPAASIPTFDEWKKAGTLRDQSPAGRTTPNSLSLIRSDDKTRSVSPSGRVFQSRRPAPKPPGKQPGITHEKDKVTEQPGITQEKDKVTEDTDGTTDESGKTENEMKEKIGKDSEESKETIKPDINETEGNNEVMEKISEPNLDEQETKETLKTQNEIKENEKVDESEIMMKTENQKNDTDTEKEKPIILSKDSEENTEEIASKKEDKDSKGGDNADIKVLARQVLMEARKKAGACSALPRDRLAMSTSQATADSSDASEGSVSTSPKLSKKSNQEEQDGSRRSSRGAKPAKPPKPSSLHEKIKAESERQSRLTEKSRESLESRRKRDTEVDESKQRQSLSKANSLITHSQQRDRKKESSNESLSKESPCDSTLEKKEEEPKLERSSSHVMGHRPLKMKFKKDKEEGSSESLEKPDKYEESDNIKRLRAVLNVGNDGKDNEGSGSESEQIKATNSDADSPAPTPPRRTSQSYQQKRHNRLSSSGSDTSVSSKTMSQNDKKSNATKPINTSSKTPQESPGDGVSASTSPSKKGFASSKTISQNDKKSNATKPIDIPSKTPQESPGDGVSASTSPSKKGFVSRAAAVQAYAESRKMKFEEFALPPGPPSSQPPPPPKPPRTMVYEEQEGPSNVKNNKTTEEQNKKEEESDDDAQNTLEDEMNKSIGSADSSDLQDTSEYVKQELEALAQEQAALDKVAAKLEKELRGAMKNKGCEEEEEKLLQSWFILVDKKNELVRRQTELSILEKEDDLERRYEMLNRELRGLLSKEEWEKTEEDKELEANLLQELVVLVNKRDQLVQIEDTQLQQMERDEKHIRQVVQSAQLSQNKSDCVLQ